MLAFIENDGCRKWDVRVSSTIYKVIKKHLNHGEKVSLKEFEYLLILHLIVDGTIFGPVLIDR